MQRVQEEMDRQGLSRNGLSKRPGAPSQMTINDVMNGADPKLLTVHKMATALGVQAWQLLTPRVVDTPQSAGKVHKFPDLYPPIFPQRSTESHGKAKRQRKA